MPAKLTTTLFITRASEIYGNIYNYSKTKYLGNNKKVQITCLLHNETFWQTPHAHLRPVYGCHKCANEKKAMTNIKKYGVKNVLESKNIRDQIKITNIKKYGFEHAMQSDKIKERKIKTCLNRYDVSNPTKNEKIQQKIKDTNLQKYGVEYVAQVKEFRELAKQTNLERYGFEYAIQSDKIKERVKQTNLKKYGVEHYTKLKSTIEKRKASNLKKYGVEHTMQQHIDAEALSNLNNREWVEMEYVTNKKSARLIAKELGVADSTVLRYLRKHEIEIVNYGTSDNEKNLIDFIKSILSNVEIITNTNKIIPPYELDIYIPEHNIAIEYNGLYWHSEAAGKIQEYHLTKTELCESKGIRLIHIFEDEWIEQNLKCKDTLRHLFGKSPRGVYARNVIVREIEWKQAKAFLNKYHLLGAGTPGNYRIGAFDKDDNLVGVMVFGHKNNEGHSSETELKRFVTNKKNNPGLGSKMFKHAVRTQNYTEIIAFVDRRWFTGLVKDHIGFKKINNTAPALWWTNGSTRHHRRFITKAQLRKDGYDTALSKRELLLQLGYFRIWDCGKIKLKWNNTPC